MASGCLNDSSNGSPCAETISAKCVIYQGPAFSQFGICSGDTIDETTEIILNKLADYAEGEGIELSSITANCSFITDFLANKDKELTTLVQALFDIGCSLKGQIDEINGKFEPPFSFSTQCLTVSGTPSRNAIIQALINKTCENTAAIDNITNDLGDTSDIVNNIQNIIGDMVLEMFNSCANNLVKSGSGSTASILLTAQNPIGTYLWGDYPLSAFDGTGKGLASAGYCGYALANGNNGTWDMRGLGPSGATNIPGPALLPVANPGTDLDLATNPGSIKGQYKVTLTSPQLPNHNHTSTVTQNPHSHSYNNVISAAPGPGYEAIRSDAKYEVDPGTPNLFRVPGTQTSNETIDININITGVTGGSGQSHENRQPTRYGVWIKRIS